MRFRHLRTLAVILTLHITTFATPSVSQTVGGAISGDRVDVAPELEAPKPLPAETAKEPPPFGFNLFTGGFRAEREDGLNPQYVVQPGDQLERIPSRRYMAD